MMQEEQLLLFYEPREDMLVRQVKELKEQLSNTRKGLFKRHQQLTEMYLELYRELEIMKYIQKDKGVIV